MSNPAIPIENIYYLFCYAWDRFAHAQAVDVGAEPSPDLPNLLARVLTKGTTTVLRRGLDRGYQLFEEDIATVRGHIDLAPSLQLRARSIRRLHCEFDELSHDLLHNQIIKATLKRLSRAAGIEPLLAREMTSLVARMGDVSDIRLDPQIFSRVQLHRNNAHYSFLLHVARLAFDCILPTKDGQGFRFEDVLRDEVKMAGVFESFVRNFYRAEQSKYKVKPLTIEWDAEPLSLTGVSRLPDMKVDVFLKSSDRSIIIDTKYYASALQDNRGSKSFHSGNLYQIFSYLKNASISQTGSSNYEGILLYPTVDATLRERFRIQGHNVTLATLDLSVPWPEIALQLHDLIS